MPALHWIKIHSSILAWRIPRTEAPGGLSPWGRKGSDTAEPLSEEGRQLCRMVLEGPASLLRNPKYWGETAVWLRAGRRCERGKSESQRHLREALPAGCAQEPGSKRAQEPLGRRHGGWIVPGPPGTPSSLRANPILSLLFREHPEPGRRGGGRSGNAGLCGSQRQTWAVAPPAGKSEFSSSQPAELCSPEKTYQPKDTAQRYFSGGSVVRNLPINAGALGSTPGWEDPLEEEMATHSRILAWKTPWTEEPGGYSPWGHTVGQDWEHTHAHALEPWEF